MIIFKAITMTKLTKKFILQPYGIESHQEAARESELSDTRRHSE